MTGTAVFAYMESEKDGILKKIVPGCKIYVKIHLKMSERKVVWQMQRVKQHKWFLFILIGFIVISFFQFLPLTDTLHLYEKTPQSFELTAGGLLKYGIEGQNADQAGECELEEYHTDRLTGPEIAERQACGLPEETPAATLARTTQSEAALGEQNQSRFQMLRFLVEVYVLLMIPAVILHFYFATIQHIVPKIPRFPMFLFLVFIPDFHDMQNIAALKSTAHQILVNFLLFFAVTFFWFIMFLF